MRSQGCVNGTLDEANYSAPMPVIGLYVAAATLVCLLLMVLDVFAGFRNKKRWFPCRFFPLNSVTLTLVAIATKLPVDLTTSMPKEEEEDDDNDDDGTKEFKELVREDNMGLNDRKLKRSVMDLKRWIDSVNKIKTSNHLGKLLSINPPSQESLALFLQSAKGRSFTILMGNSTLQASKVERNLLLHAKTLWTAGENYFPYFTKPVVDANSTSELQLEEVFRIMGKLKNISSDRYRDVNEEDHTVKEEVL
ncbi:hypothetical protein Scep_010858 [Stephania cephalantha]|uniref:Uncharacterized protein n=1 Tax=Stephania cephalantha TaxID=152367 RepID=A0AAP0JVZ0_9MAGN